ncbi:MAG: ACT domain-containing protein [Acidobacteriia bacterium]|nr:ACT domain-containing protein [Terriglobia bacterium]
MADQISRVDYYSVIVPQKAGEAARILMAVEQAGVNLIAFSGFPEGRKAQLDFVAADGPAFVKAAKSAGLDPGRKKTVFLVEAGDRVGAVAAIASKLAEAGINITSMQAICAGENRYGGLLWVKPEDVRKAAKVLGAV